MVAGSPCLCISQTAQSLFAMASSAPGAESASMSLIIDAPAASASFITRGRRVSTETGRSESDRRTGRIRRSSSSSGTGSAPGRLDSPPMSMMSAPSSASARACAIANLASKKRPPSEKESGVTFTTPMTSGLSMESENLPHLRINAASRRSGRRRFSLLVAAARRLGRGRRNRRLKRPRPPARHDVGDLLRVEGLEFQQRRRHRFHLLAVLLEELARHGVMLVYDAADFWVYLLLCL